jgi:GNAT superfamily N-acetyltransferase
MGEHGITLRICVLVGSAAAAPLRSDRRPNPVVEPPGGWHDPRMITIQPAPVDAPEAVALVRAYLTEMVDRYHGRPMPASVVDEALADEPADDVALLLVAYRGQTAVGCVGLRRAGDGTGEITKMYVSPRARRLGIGRRLLSAVEQAAREQGLRMLRLDTRTDLVEARAMYAADGYTEIPPHRERRYADHWFAKRL